MSARSFNPRANTDWEWAVLDRAAELLKVAVNQGRASVVFDVLTGGATTQRMVASLLPAWRFDDRGHAHPADEGQFGALELVVCLAATGEFVCRFAPVRPQGFSAAQSAVPLDLPDAWWEDEFTGVDGCCWAAVLAALQSGQTQARVSLPTYGHDPKASHIDLDCRLTADQVTRQFFMTVNHAQAGSLIGCTTPFYLGDEVQADPGKDWGMGYALIDDMGG